MDPLLGRIHSLYRLVLLPRYAPAMPPSQIEGKWLQVAYITEHFKHFNIINSGSSKCNIYAKKGPIITKLIGIITSIAVIYKKEKKMHEQDLLRTRAWRVSTNHFDLLKFGSFSFKKHIFISISLVFRVLVNILVMMIHIKFHDDRIIFSDPEHFKHFRFSCLIVQNPKSK